MCQVKTLQSENAWNSYKRTQRHFYEFFEDPENQRFAFKIETPINPTHLDKFVKTLNEESNVDLNSGNKFNPTASHENIMCRCKYK